MYHYFPDKHGLVQAVIGYQADSIVSRNRTRSKARTASNLAKHGDHRSEAHQSNWGLPTWLARSQLAESDPEARALIGAGFDQWAAAIGDATQIPP